VAGKRALHDPCVDMGYKSIGMNGAAYILCIGSPGRRNRFVKTPMNCFWDIRWLPMYRPRTPVSAI
jgi:hypothetical protein